MNEQRMRESLCVFSLSVVLLFVGTPHASAPALLFIGNSFTFGEGSPVKAWRPEFVTDLNHEGIGGVPALFKSFTKQAGLDYHLQNRHDLLTSRPWDIVIMHGFSTLDSNKPGDPAKLVQSTREMAELLTSRNPN